MESWDEFQRQLHKYLAFKDEEIFFVLKRKYLQTNKKFRHSKHCKLALNNCIEHISRHPGRIYVFLNDLKATFKLQISSTPKIKMSSSLQQDTTVNDQVEITSSPNPTNDTCSTSCPPSESLHPSVPVSVSPHYLPSESCCNVSSRSECLATNPTPLQESSETILAGDQSTLVSSSISDDDDVIILDSPTPSDNSAQDECASQSYPQPTASSSQSIDHENDASPKKRALIVRLEHLLSRITKAIRKLEEQELDLDELESCNSAYMQLDVLKRRYLEVWRRLCEARQVARISGRIIRRPFSFSGCQYAKVNALIEEMVNKQKKFPDFTDVYAIVSSVNKQENLKLSSVGVTLLAREVFIDVGHQLKRRRQVDLRHDFGSHLTDSLQEDDDPIYSDLSLRRQLVENKHIGEAKLDSVFDKFVRLQYAGTPSHPDDDRLDEEEEPHLKIETASSDRRLPRRIKPTPVATADVEENCDTEQSDSDDSAEECDSERLSNSSKGSATTEQKACELITISSDSEVDDDGPVTPIEAPTEQQTSSAEASDIKPTVDDEYPSVPLGGVSDTQADVPSSVEGTHTPTAMETNATSPCSTAAVGDDECEQAGNLNQSTLPEAVALHSTDAINVDDSDNESNSDSEVIMSEFIAAKTTPNPLGFQPHSFPNAASFNQTSWCHPSPRPGFYAPGATMVRHASQMVTVTTQQINAFGVTASRHSTTTTTRLVCHQMMAPPVPLMDIRLVRSPSAVFNGHRHTANRPRRGRLMPSQHFADRRRGLLALPAPPTIPPRDSIPDDNCIELD